MSQIAEEIREYLRERKNAPVPSSIKETRVSYEEMASKTPLFPNTVVEKAEINGIKAEWVAAPNIDKNRVVLYLHGGGYVFCSPITHRALASRLSASSNSLVLVLDYRLAPEHPFPSALEDSCSAYRWLLKNNFSNEKIFICGDSAGGGLTLSTLVSLRDNNEILPNRVALISPWTDLAATGDSLVSLAEIDPWLEVDGLKHLASLYLAGNDPKHPLVSPLFANLSNLPPMLIQVGSDEILLDDSVRLAKLAQAAGVSVELQVWQKMWHVWHAFADKLVEGQQAIDKIGQFFRS